MEDVVEPNKLFVGGMSRETTDDVLREHFGEYGTVLSSVFAVDWRTGKPRGYAFVTFSESSAVDRALRDSHQILGKVVDVKRAIPKSKLQSQQEMFGTKKIFVGGLSANMTKEDLSNYFKAFGNITDVVVMHENMTHKSRGFGFVTFDSEDSVKEVMQNNFHELGGTGKLVEVKRAVPKHDIQSISNNFNSSCQQGSYAPIPCVGYYPTVYDNYSYGAGIYGMGYSYQRGSYDGSICYGLINGPPVPVTFSFLPGFWAHSYQSL